MSVPDTATVLARAFENDAARLGAKYGRLDVDPGRAAAIWLAPEKRISVRSITSAFDAVKATVIEPPFWPLFILGVEPSERCYLETTEESNLAFYRRHGFEVSSDHAPAGLPAFWTMTRQPG